MKFIMVLVMMLSTTLGNFVNVDNFSQYLSSEHDKVADYISQNLELFVEKYAESSEDDVATESADESTDQEILNQPQIDRAFNPSSIEYRTEVILTKGGTATYLDFDDNNGYMLIEDDYILSKFETEGDLPWARNVTTLYYDEDDDFMIEVEDELVPAQYYFDMIAAQEAGEDQALEEAQAGYYGQAGNGYTKLFSPSFYFGDRYGKTIYDYKLSNRTVLDRFNGFFVQDQLAIYRRGNGEIEGNCAPTAMYNIMYYYKHIRGYSYLDDTYAQYSATQDPFYYATLFTGYQSYKSITLPKLYTGIRTAAMSVGYNLYGLPLNRTSDFLRMINYVIPYQINNTTTGIPSVSFIRNSINAGKPLMMIYGDYLNYDSLHAVAVFGVSTYTWTYKRWIFTVKDNRNAIMMSEGQPRAVMEQNVVYMDWEGYMSSCGNPTMKLYSISLT